MERITGIIDEWIISAGMIWGRVFGDSKHRFSEGQYIHTSEILEMSTDRPIEGTPVETRNSIYQLGKPAADEVNLELKEAYESIRRKHGYVLKDLKEHVRQIRLAIELNDNDSYRKFIQRFMFADDGVRHNVLE